MEEKLIGNNSNNNELMVLKCKNVLSINWDFGLLGGVNKTFNVVLLCSRLLRWAFFSFLLYGPND